MCQSSGFSFSLFIHPKSHGFALRLGFESKLKNQNLNAQKPLSELMS